MEEIELTIRDEDKDGVFAVSMVKNPAIEENWIALSKQQVQLQVVDEERRIVVGLALVPEKRIYRMMKGKEFNVWFSAATIAKTQELYMRNLNGNNVTTEHEKPVDGVSVIESWVVEDIKHDKTNIWGLKAAKGSWALMMKIYNDDEWKQVQDGTYQGFSIEGSYHGFEQLQSRQLSDYEKNIELVKQIINKYK